MCGPQHEIQEKLTTNVWKMTGTSITYHLSLILRHGDLILICQPIEASPNFATDDPVWQVLTGKSTQSGNAASERSLEPPQKKKVSYEMSYEIPN